MSFTLELVLWYAINNDDKHAWITLSRINKLIEHEMIIRDPMNNMVGIITYFLDAYR